MKNLLNFSQETGLNPGELEIYTELKEKLKPGDIVFIRIPNYLYRRISDTTQSWTSHVGFVYGKKDGDWLIAESAVPLTGKCTLQRFLKRSEKTLVSVRRLRKSLTSDDIAALQKAADERMGIWYHTGFNYNSRRQFCSKFVHDVYREAINMQIGELITFEELLAGNPEGSLTFWRLWYFGFIPWKRVTVTPASQYISDKLETVYDNTAPLQVRTAQNEI